jgi:hypothetical protein
MSTSIKSIFPLCLLLTFAGAAAAQTPDGSPPSEETVCDGQTGAAYGLCTAFCEAMDCDSDDPQASQTACDKVGEKFLTITGQAPPCVAHACPCVDGVPGFIEALNGEFGLTSCQEQVFPGFELVRLTTGDGRFPSSQTSVTGLDACGFFPGGESLVFIPESEAAACIALIREKAAAAGLTCTPM